MSQGPERGGGSFRVQSLMMTLEMYINTYIVVQRGPGNRLDRSKVCFLLVIVEIIREIVGKQERRSCFFFYFFGLWPILSEGPPGGREGC